MPMTNLWGTKPQCQWRASSARGPEQLGDWKL